MTISKLVPKEQFIIFTQLYTSRANTKIIYLFLYSTALDMILGKYIKKINLKLLKIRLTQSPLSDISPVYR